MKFKKRLTYKDFLKYFSNSLPNKEKHAFEKEMMQDEFESDAFDGLSRLDKGELKKDIGELTAGISKRTRSEGWRLPLWIRYAASIIILIGASITIYYVNDSLTKEEIAQETIKKESEKIDDKKDRSAFAADEKYDEVVAETIVDKPEGEIRDEIIIEEPEFTKSSEVKTGKRDKGLADVFEEPIRQEAEDEIPILEMVESDDVIALTENDVEEKEIHEETVSTVSGKMAGVAASKKRRKEVSQEELTIRGARSRASAALIETRTIRGRVMTSYDESIPFASVVVEGTRLGTVTDMDGNFKLDVPVSEDWDTLKVSYVGFETGTFPVAQDSNLVLILEESLMAVEEVVVTSLGVEREKSNMYESQYGSRIDTRPDFPGGYFEYKKYIQENLDYSAFSNFPGRYRIKYSFLVNEDGSLSDFQFQQVPDSIFMEEIKQVMQSGPYWVPAYLDSEPISTRVKFRLKIEVENSDN